MKDGEKALLALAAVGGYLYWSKTETKFDHSKERRPAWISRNHHHDPSSPYTMGADGEMINMASVGKPKKGEIFNALNPVASSVPRERTLKLITNQGEMIAKFSPRPLRDPPTTSAAADLETILFAKRPDA